MNIVEFFRFIQIFML